MNMTRRITIVALLAAAVPAMADPQPASVAPPVPVPVPAEAVAPPAPAPPPPAQWVPAHADVHWRVHRPTVLVPHYVAPPAPVLAGAVAPPAPAPAPPPPAVRVSDGRPQPAQVQYTVDRPVTLRAYSAGDAPSDGSADGKVIAVEEVDGQTYLQIDLGRADGVRVDTPFKVRRGDQFLGDLTVVRLDDHAAVGRVTLNQGIDIAAGDSVGSGSPFVIARAARTENVGHIGVVTTGDLPDELRAHLDLPRGVGLLVQHVVKDSPAEKAGIKQHDVLHKLDDQLLVNGEQLGALVRMHDAGDEVTITVIRGAKPTPIRVTVGEKQVPAGALNEGASPMSNYIRVYSDPGQRRAEYRILTKPGDEASLHLTPMTDNIGTRLAVSKDGEHVIELSVEKDARRVKVTDAQTGKVLFEGAADSPDLPEALKPKVQKLNLSTDAGVWFQAVDAVPDASMQRAVEFLKRYQAGQQSAVTKLEDVRARVTEETLKKQLASIQADLDTQKLHEELELLRKYMSESHPRVTALRNRLETSVDGALQKNLDELRARVNAEMLGLAKQLHNEWLDAGDADAVRREIDKRLEQAFKHHPKSLHLGLRAEPAATIQQSAKAVYSDGEHTLTVTTDDQGRRLRVQNKSGDAVFDGPINTPEQRREVPSEVLKKLERLERQTK
jgi:hypothetical protein